ncbi:NADH-quinone oxidoreductase subunit NuoE [Bdellovibrionota bacterium]
MSVQFSPESKKKIEEYLSRYPNKRAALIPVLMIAQEELGALTNEVQILVAETLGLPPVDVKEVVTFYGMFHETPRGKKHIKVCTTLSCALKGAHEILDYLRERFGVEINEVTPDGKYSYEPCECLGSCGTAPVVMHEKGYTENLTKKKLDELLEEGR